MKQISPKYLPVRINLLTLPIVYTMVDYWDIPTWVFAVYATIWVILATIGIFANVKSDKIDFE